MVRERFCWPNRKVAIPVMCCEEVQHGLKGTYSPVFLGRHTHMCVSQAYHAHAFRFFCWPEWPENRDGTHQLLGQREPEVSVWHGAEKETAGGGGWTQKSTQKPKKARFSNGHGWNQYSQWISGPSAMPKSPWLFSGSEVAAFQSFFSAYACDFGLFRGVHFSRETQKKLNSNWLISHTGFSVFHLGCVGVGLAVQSNSATLGWYLGVHL